MKLFDDLSLGWKIPLRVMGAVVGTALAITVALLVRDYDDMRANLESHAKRLGSVLANTLVTPVLHDDLWRAFEILRSARAARAEVAEFEAQLMLVLDADQRVFVSSRPAELPVGSQLAAQGGVLGSLATALAVSPGQHQQVHEPAQGNDFFVTSPMIADGVLLGHVALGYSKSSFLPRYLDIVFRAGTITLLALVLILPVSWIWARRTAQPLVALAGAMEALPDQPDLSATVTLPRSRDEIGRLADAYRTLVAELQRKQALEQQMVSSERLAAVGRLSAGIAHEINNPLAGMLTAITTYQRHGSADPLALQTLSLLERGLSQIRNTVAALLVETRVQDRQLDPDDISDLLILVEAELQARQVTLERNGELTAPVSLPATLVRQIMLNLLLNAIAAADTGGKVRLGLHAETDMLHLSVCNDGEHIPEAQMNFLFEPFATGRDKGHGLGLWIVYQIVRELNGGITVDSEPGCTTFHVDLPYASN